MAGKKGLPKGDIAFSIEDVESFRAKLESLLAKASDKNPFVRLSAVIMANNLISRLCFEKYKGFSRGVGLNKIVEQFLSGSLISKELAESLIEDLNFGGESEYSEANLRNVFSHEVISEDQVPSEEKCKLYVLTCLIVFDLLKNHCNQK
jgi:GTPase SAR1 family protein